MKPISYACLLRNIGLLIVALVTALVSVVTIAANAASTSGEWTSPSDIRIKKVGPAPQVRRSPIALPSTDCHQLSYRLINSAVMETGCFSSSASGMFESDSLRAIFHGTDEAITIKPYRNSQSLIPWPNSGVMLSFQPAPVDGSYVGIYKHFSNALQDNRSPSGLLLSKSVTKDPDILLAITTGERLIANLQTLAFSAGGSWMAIQTYQGGFVRINLATLEVLAFGPNFAFGNSAEVNRSRLTVSPSGRFVAIANAAAPAIFTIYDLHNCQMPSTPATTIIKPLTCRSYDYQASVRDKVNDIRSIQQVRFLNDELLSFEVWGNIAANNAMYILSPKGSVDSSLNYLGLGDSYTSGEGAFNYVPQTDSTDNMCHASISSYPMLLMRELPSLSGGHSVACSGAVINDVGSTSDNYRGQVRAGPSFKELQQANPALLQAILSEFLPGYIAQQRFEGRYQPTITTVGVGGNDIGFGRILQECVMPKIKGRSCFNNYEDRLEITQLIDRTRSKWTGLYKTLRSAAPQTTLYAVGYPQVTVADGNCAANVHLDRNELLFTEQLITYLNRAIAQSASDAGVVYVDISRALVGHRLCEAASYNVAVNGLTSGKDAGVLGIQLLGKESYHPNALGHRLIAQTILHATNGFKSQPSGQTEADSQHLLVAPRANRPVLTRLRQDIAPDIATKGQTLPVSFDGQAAGLKTQTVYTVLLDGELVHSTATSDNATLDTSFIMPMSAEPGVHTLSISGVNQADRQISIEESIYVPHAQNDMDGDGKLDATDSCPLGQDSNQDRDEDHIDDGCDPMIGPAAFTRVPIINASFSSTSLNLGEGAPPVQNTAQPSRTSNLKNKQKYQEHAEVHAKHNMIKQLGSSRQSWPDWLLWLYIVWIVLSITDRRLHVLHKRHILKG